MDRKILLGIVMAIAFTSCTQEDVFKTESGLKTLNAKIESEKIDSRVGFTDETNAQFFWTKGDQIGVTTSSSNTLLLMTLNEADKGKNSGSFTGSISSNPSGYAVYPYYAKDDGFSFHTINEGNLLSYHLRASYSYSKLDSEYANDEGNSHDAPMWGSISNGTVTFKHLGGVIVFEVNELPENTTNLKFKLTATNKINGSFSATLTDQEPKIVSETTSVESEKTVEISFSTLSGQTKGYFYVPVPTGDLGNLTAVVLKEDNSSTGLMGAWDNISIARKDIRRAVIGSQSIVGGDGEIKQVASVSDVKEALTTTEDNLTVQVSEEVTGTDNIIEIPTTLETTTTTFSFASVADGAKITIKDEDNGSYDGTIIIEVPVGETIPEVEATVPNGEVYIKQGKVTTLVTSSASNTTIIGAGVEVGTLTVKKGNVRIENGGAVNTINRSEDNNDEVTYVIYEASQAPTISLADQLIVLVSATEWDLRKAIADETVSSYQLEDDIVLAEPLTIPSGKTFTLDLNSKTISQEKACTASYSMITNNGSLTITGNGKISFKDTGEGDPSFGWGSYTISNYGGTLTVENGTIEHLGEQTFATHMICAIFQYSGSTTINGGTISTPTYRSARLWDGDMTINDGTFEGQLWLQDANANITAKLTINGGTFEPKGNDGSSVFIGNEKGNIALAVNGGTFNTKIGCSDPTKEGVKGSVKGGVFTESAKTKTNSALIAEGYAFEEYGEGNYKLTPAFVKTSETSYQIHSVGGLKLFREAVNAGNTFNGYTIELKANIDLNNEQWSPIGTKDTPFEGTFNGSCETISRLTITSGDFVGFFGYVSDATIQNVTLTDANVSGGERVAAMIGKIIGNATVEGCTVSGSVTGSDSNTGGIIGEIINGTVTLTGLTNNATVTNTKTSNSRAGGVVGQVTTNANVTLTNCKNAGTITTADGYAGGIVSAYQSGTLNFNNCENSGSLTGKYTGNMLGWYTTVRSITISTESNTFDLNAIGCVDITSTSNMSLYGKNYFVNRMSDLTGVTDAKQTFSEIFAEDEIGTFPKDLWDKLISFYTHAAKTNSNFSGYPKTYWEMFNQSVGYSDPDWNSYFNSYNEQCTSDGLKLTKEEFNSSSWRQKIVYSAPTEE